MHVCVACRPWHGSMAWMGWLACAAGEIAASRRKTACISRCTHGTCMHVSIGFVSVSWTVCFLPHCRRHSPLTCLHRERHPSEPESLPDSRPHCVFLLATFCFCLPPLVAHARPVFCLAAVCHVAPAEASLVLCMHVSELGCREPYLGFGGRLQSRLPVGGGVCGLGGLGGLSCMGEVGDKAGEARL